MKIIAFGNLAIMAPEGALDTWLCVPIFRWVCPYRCDRLYYFINFVSNIALDGTCVNRIGVPRLCSRFSTWLTLRKVCSQGYSRLPSLLLLAAVHAGHQGDPAPILSFSGL